MIVAVMHVGHMWVRVNQRRMLVPVSVLFGAGDVFPMAVPMMRVVSMRMGVRRGFMSMFMFVMLAQMQPDSYRHEGCSGHEL